MCLTEPQCGTDLGLIRTRAEPNGDGTYAITGTKIFITSGEQDLTENIVHLVLARLPDAPKGTRGISLFLVPKFLPKDDGTPGPRNGVMCAGIEHKMGINGSATCVMNFERATGWLLGEPHRGMRAMFTMMNDARLDVGMQGLAIAETAYQSAVAYARERLQGRALSGAKQPDRPADPIIVHPDVRRMLLTMRASTEGARALAYWVGMALDLAKRHPDPQARQDGRRPDRAADADHQGVLHRSGLGVRQPRHPGLRRPRLHQRMGHGAAGARCPHHPALRGHERHPGARPGRAQARRALRPLAARVLPPGDGVHRAAAGRSRAGRIRAAARQSLCAPAAGHAARRPQGLRDPNEAGAASYDYLRLFALVALAYLWARMVEVAKAKLAAGADGDASFYEAKVGPRASS